MRSEALRSAAAILVAAIIVIVLLSGCRKETTGPDKVHTFTEQTDIDYSYPTVPDYVKDYAWDQGHKYADGMEVEAYNKAQTDFFNGYCTAWLQNK